jgi:gamma-glutamylcyclotransferase (GGCT)/AIG2-like uncharacterized protein YtfP
VNAIFVYGLLKPGFSLYGVAEPFVVSSAPAKAVGRLFDAGVPAARFDEEGTIEGFVFWLDPDRMDEALRVLDELEEEGDVYRRQEIDVNTEGEQVRTFAYHYLGAVDGLADVGAVWERREGRGPHA